MRSHHPRAIAILLLSICLAVVPLQADPTPQRDGSCEFSTGHDWLNFTEQEKAAYLLGIRDAVEIGLSAMTTSGLTEKSLPYTRLRQMYPWGHSLTLGDWSAEVTHLYNDPSNWSIPVSFMSNYALKTMAGTPKDQIEEILAASRKTYAQHKHRSCE